MCIRDSLEPAFQAAGYHLVVLDNDNRDSVDVGLKYVNNDACYPSLMVVGQIMSAVMSGKYDMTKTAILISQTGGGCRASNYIGFIRRALEKAGYKNVPVISINLSGLEKNPGFKFTPQLIPVSYTHLKKIIHSTLIHSTNREHLCTYCLHHAIIGLFIERFLFLSAGCCLSVSYTHLDVYKRQGLCHAIPSVPVGKCHAAAKKAGTFTVGI